MSRILIIKSLEDALRTYDKQSTVTPQNYYEVLGRLTHLSNAQRRPDVTRRLPMVPVKKPSQINLEEALEDHHEDQIVEQQENREDFERQRREMMEAEREIRDRHKNEDYLNWLQNPNTTLKAETPPIFNPETHEDLTALRWIGDRHINTAEQAQPIIFGGRGSTGWWEDMIDSTGGETLPGYKQGYIDRTTGTWVNPADLESLINPDLSQNLDPSGKMRLLGYPGYEGIPNYHRLSSKGSGEGLSTPEGFQFGGYNRDDITEVKLPEGVRSPLEFSQLLLQAEIHKPKLMQSHNSKQKEAMRRVVDWGRPIGIKEVNRDWEKKPPATFQELLDAGHFKVASEDEAKIDTLSILKEIVDINHNEELDDNFKDDIMTLDRNHTMTRNQNGTMIENITPEMKNVIELMASNYNNNEPEPKGKEKSPFFV